MFRLPREAVIAREKLTQYLLIPLTKDDKSKFLAQAGYTLKNWEQLEHALRSQVLTEPAEFLETTRYGDKYAIHAQLQGPNGTDLKILTIWMMTDGQAKFVTLVPDQGESS
jgi:hypothetical protein